MSDKDSTLRLNLAASGMLTMLQTLAKEADKLAKEVEGVGEKSEKTEKKIHPMLASGKKAWGAATTAAMDLGKQLVSVAGQAATLGGALSMGAGIKAGVDLVSTYKHIAFAIRTGTGTAQSWQQVQEHVSATAERWGRSNEEVAHSYDELFRELGNVEFAKKASDTVAKAAAATGKDAATLTHIAVELGDKFGISADQIDEAMSTIVGTNKLEEFSGGMERLGAMAKSLGYQGTDGLKQMVGMLEASGGATKDLNKAVMGLGSVMESLQDVDKSKDIEKKFKMKLRGDDGELKKDVIQQILKATGGQKEELGKVFAGDGLKIMTEYGRMYSSAYDKTTGTFEERSNAAMASINSAFENAVKKPTDLGAEANANNLDDPKAKLQRAMNHFTDAFAQPKLIAAVNKLADKAPALADGMAKLLDFALDHPLLAGAGLLGGKGAMAFGGSMAQDGAAAAGKSVLKALTGSAIGKKLGLDMAEGAAASGKWKTAGAAFGIVAAALIADEIGKAIIDARVAAMEAEQNKTILTGVEAAQAAKSGDVGRMKKVREDLASRIASMDEDSNSLGHRLERGAGRLVEGADFQTGDDKVKAAAKADLAALDEAIGKAAGSTDKGATATERLAQSAERAAKALERLGNPAGGGGGTNGLPPVPPGGV